MTRWNPSDPSVVGPEFLAGYESTFPVSGLAPAVQRFRSNATETIAALRLHRSVTASGGGPSMHLAELYAAGDEVDDGLFTTVTYAPNVLTVAAGTVQNASGGAPAVGDIDEWPPVLTDYVTMGSTASFDLQFASAGLASTGRIAMVGVEVVTPWGTPPLSTSTDQVRRTVVSLRNGGSSFGTITRIVPQNNAAGTAGRYFFSWGEVNPITGQPWIDADIEALDTATTEVRLARQSGDGGGWITAAVRLVVVYENTERRLARGIYATAGTTAAGWTGDVALASPAGVANWSKANATDYALMVRKADQGSVTLFAGDYVYLTTVHAVAGQPVPPDLPSYTGTGTTVTHLTDGSVLVRSVAWTAETEQPGRLLPFVLRTTAPATSADGQPYTVVRSPGVFFGAGITQQELRSTGAPVIAGLRLSCGYFGVLPTADLTVELRRRSDSVVMGTFTVTPADLTAAGAVAGALVVVEVKVPDPGFATAAATQYYLEFTSSTPSSGSWIVGLLAVQAGGGGVLYQEATYSGGTDQADPIGGAASTSVDYTPADVSAVLDAAVTGPAGFTAAAGLDPLPDIQPCPLDGIPYVALGWGTTSLGSDFARYELERLHPDYGWQLIAAITAENDVGFPDLEARLGVAESYRLRVVRTDGASSYYTDIEVATAAAAGCGYTFTSNEAPTMSVGYPDVYDGRPTRTYGFPEAAEVEFRTMYGRDYQVAFKPLARRGVTFDRTLNIGGMAAPAAGIGPPAAAMLRDLAWATLSYVCVRDQDGNRWYANVRVPDLAATRYADVHIHNVSVLVVEVTATPSTPAAGTAIEGGPLSFMSGEPILFMDGDPMEAVS